MNVAEALLSRGADAAEAISHRGSSTTYGALREKVLRIASVLLDRGYGKGDRIGIFSENSPFFVSAYLGIIRAGLIAVPLQTELTERVFAGIIADTGTRALFLSNRFRGRVQPWADELGLGVFSECYDELESAPPIIDFPEINAAGDLAALMFTSGSTGSPKGVMVTHRNIECNTADIISYMGLHSGDRAMVVLPFHYCFGLSLLHTHLMVGASIVLNNEFRLFPEAMVAEMQRKHCTGLAGVPSTYQILLRRSRFRQLPFPHLRWFQQAGGKLPNACIEEIVAAFPGVDFFLMYGQTEATARLSYLPPEKLAEKMGSIGKGLPSTQLEVIGKDGRPVVPGSEEVGEIVASGDNVTKGYWNDAQETSRFFRNGSLHTGDIARVDSDGFIFVVEREREMIKCGGNRISAKEIEDVIAELAEVVEVAVIGCPHDILGEAIKALIVPSRDLTRRKVEDHCGKRLPGFKVPQEIIFLHQLPHNGAGKILKQELRKLFENTGAPPRQPKPVYEQYAA